MTFRIRNLPEGQFPTAEQRKQTLRYELAMELLGLDKWKLARAHDVPVETMESVLAGRAFIETGPAAQLSDDFNRNDALTALGVDADMQGYL